MTRDTLAPHQLRDETLSTLRQCLIKLKSPECMLALRKASDEVQTQWARTLLKCDEARDNLEIAQLAQIRDQLKANEDKLIEGAKDLREALTRLSQIKQVLDIATTFLGIVARVLAIV